MKTFILIPPFLGLENVFCARSVLTQDPHTAHWYTVRVLECRGNVRSVLAEYKTEHRENTLSDLPTTIISHADIEHRTGGRNG